MSQTETVKARTLDKIISHLNTAVKTEPRKRERRRAQIALNNITKWMRCSQNELNAHH